MKYSTALAERIAERVAGGDLLRDIAKAKDMPLLATLRRWRKRHEEFAKLLADAFTESAEALVAEMADIRDELKGELDLGACRSAEIRLKNLTWLASNLDRERWGPQQRIELEAQATVQIRDFTGVKFDGSGMDAKPIGLNRRKSLPREPVILPPSVAESILPRRKRLQVDV